MAIILLLVLLALPASAQTLMGTVSHVRDGDTFMLRTATDSVAVRVYAVNCPERGKPFYHEAAQFARAWLLGRTVCVDSLGHSYDRVVGAVWVDNQSYASLLVAYGCAWHDRKYDSDRRLDALQCQAFSAGIGLWAVPE